MGLIIADPLHRNMYVKSQITAKAYIINIYDNTVMVLLVPS